MLKRNFAGLISLGIVLLFSACAAAKDTEADMQTDSFYISEITDEFDVLGIQGNGGSLRVLEEAGLELSEDHKFARNMQKQIPALAAGAWTDPDGAFHSWTERGQNEISDSWINDDQILEYNHLIDTKNRVDSVFLPD